MTKTDFVDIGNEFMHMRPATGDFAFDPVRGVIANWSDSEVIDDDYLFYMHSNDGSGSSRLFALEVSLNGFPTRLAKSMICCSSARPTPRGRPRALGGTPNRQISGQPKSKVRKILDTTLIVKILTG